MQISARKLMQHTPDDVWENLSGALEGFYDVVFDDGSVVKIHSTLLKYSLPGWGFHRAFPSVPLLPRHLAKLSGDRLIKTNSYISQLGAIVDDVWRHYWSISLGTEKEEDLIDQICRVGVKCCSKLYNLAVRHMDEYQISFDISHYYAITHDPELMDAIANATHDKEGIEHIYKTVDSVLRSERHRQNPIIIGVLIGACREAQFKQIAGARGFASDLDREIYPRPIMERYMDGFRLLVNFIEGSRDNTQAQANTEAPLKTTEYFSRKTQMLAFILVKLHRMDCGTVKTLNWLVEPHELTVLKGKNYYNEQNELAYFKGDETHLIGKYVRLRSVFGQCAHPDRMGVCSICFGQLSRNIPKVINLGRSMMVELFHPITQKVLGTKHHIASNNKNSAPLDEIHAKYLVHDGETQTYLLNPWLQTNKRVCLLLSPIQATNLTDIHENSDVGLVEPSRITKFEFARNPSDRKSKKASCIVLEITDHDGLIEQVSLSMTQSKTSTSLSREMLGYIQQYGYSVDTGGNFVVDLANWEYSLPLVNLPSRHFDMIDFQKEVEEFLTRRVYDEEEDGDLTLLLKEFIALILSKVEPENANLAVLETVLYCYCVDGSPNGSAFPPKAGQPLKKLRLQDLYNLRSAAPLLAFEKQASTLANPAQLMMGMRPNSAMDEIFAPEFVKL